MRRFGCSSAAKLMFLVIMGSFRKGLIRLPAATVITANRADQTGEGHLNFRIFTLRLSAGASAPSSRFADLARTGELPRHVDLKGPSSPAGPSLHRIASSGRNPAHG